MDEKLSFELVPSTAWGSNLRDFVSQRVWDKIRKSIYAKYDYKCGICGVSGVRLNCHEIWEYDDKTHIQHLKGFISLCNMCHFVKHIGFARVLANEGKLNYQSVEDHYMRINMCSDDDLKVRYFQAFEQYHERSEHEWKTNLGEYYMYCSGSKLADDRLIDPRDMYDGIYAPEYREQEEYMDDREGHNEG